MPHPAIRFTARVEIQAASGKGPRRFIARAYTGGALSIPNWSMPVVIDLGGLTARATVAANLDHDNSKRVGQVDGVENDGRALTLAGVVSAASEAAQEFLASADRGYRWGASIEAAPDSVREIAKGETVQANGRTFAGPLYLTTKSTLVGVAFLAVPADEKSCVSIAAKLKTMNQSDFQTWLSDIVPANGDMTHEQLAGLHANYHGRSEVTAADRTAVLPMIHAASASDPVEAEGKRLRQVEAACRGEWADHSAEVAELRARAIENEISVDDLISHLRPIRSEIAMSSLPTSRPPITSKRDANPQVIQAALCLAGGLTNPEEHFSEQVLDAADKQKDVGIQSVILEAAAANGMGVRPGTRITAGNLREVLGYAFPPIHASGGFSTMSLPSTLANTANKFMRDGWNQVDQTCLRIASIKSAKDFKEMTTVSLTGGMVFEQLGPGGELEHGGVDETVYRNQVHTYGLMFAITRTDIINDDLGVLSAVPRKIGRGGMLKLNKLFWTVFLGNGGGSFFHTSHANVSTNTGALSLIGLEQAERVFINQTDPDGEPLGISPAILLVPPALKSTALSLMNSQLVVSGASTTLPSANVWQSRFRVESAPYMENASYSGNSAVAWYLLADPAAMPVIEIAALNGNVMPTVESAAADFNTLGVQMRGYSDVGVALQEYRGGVRADGSAAD